MNQWNVGLRGTVFCLWLTAALCGTTTAAPHTHTAGPATSSGLATPQAIQAAIEKAQAYLLSLRNKEGNWEEVAKPEAVGTPHIEVINLKSAQWGGQTAIATYALLASGEDARSPDMKTAIDFLLTANINSTYGLGIDSQILIPEFKLQPKETRIFMKRNTALLLAGMFPPSPNLIKQPQQWTAATGFYSYWTGNPPGGSSLRPAKFDPNWSPTNIGRAQPAAGFDRSNGQYAVLGMWALEEAGGEIPTSFWEIEDAAWRKAQLHDGGWDYTGASKSTKSGASTPSMTAAGIATLFITQDYTLNEDWGQCKGVVRNENIERGLKWMDEHIAQALAGDTYTMYGIERIGTASGRKYFGTADWFKIGSQYLVTHQGANGSWGGGRSVLSSTCFALLFLSRGRAPVLMNKLEYQSAKADKAIPDSWAERPRDVANLAKWVGKEEETYLNWQVVNLKVAPEELHDAPILYIAGNQPLEFTKEEQDKLRTYVEQGGLILGNADCGKEAFVKSFTKLGSELFPKYEFKQVAPTDFIYSEQFKEFRVKPRALELNNGVRKLMVLIPEADPSRAWQTRSAETKGGLFGLGANIFLYAVDKKNILAKGETYIVKKEAGVTPSRTLKVCRLDVGDNADPEPGAWARMAGVMHNLHKIDLQVTLAKPEAISDAQVAVLTGTGKLTLSPASRSAISGFVSKGGTLIIDSAGGDVEFADAAEKELAEMFPNGKVELLAENDPVYTRAELKPDKPLWRQFAENRVGDRKHPKLRGLTVGSRVAVYFSREDLTAGLVGEPVDGIYGYTPEVATDLMAAILLGVK